MPSSTPNILLVMFDQLAPQSLPIYGHPLVKTPRLESVAEGGTVFDSASCNSPLCAPSRFSMLSGQYCSRIGAYDNASEFPSAIPTMAHYLRDLGYRTCLAGKMHFVGPDQLHGFEERITTDVYPADFGWTPDWQRPERCPFWYHNMLSVVEAGVYERTLELDYDEEVAFHAARKIYDMARDDDERPFFLAVSFIQPHDPYMTPRAYWDRYDHDAIDMPAVPSMPPESEDPHSRRLRHVYQTSQYRIQDHHVRSARHAYYGMISYLDDQIGVLGAALDRAGLGGDTLWVITSDHGDMLGERGLWYKMSFFERSVRVPLIMRGPGIPAARRVSENVSLLDLLPTLVAFASDGEAPELAAPVDGRSLLPLFEGESRDWPDAVIAEYLAEGTTEPMLMVRQGANKYVSCPNDPPQLFDLGADAHELDNLAGDPRVTDIETSMKRRCAAHWDAATVKAQVLESQHRRHLIHRALNRGAPTPWDYQPRRDASRDYNRNYGGEMYDTDRRARIPYRDAPPPDGDA